LQAVAAAQRAGQLDAETVARIRAAEALFAVGRRDEGREQAVYAVQVAPTAVLRAEALVVLGDIERKLEDLVAAERHYRAAIDADEIASGAPAYGYLSQLLLMRGALDEARYVSEGALKLCRQRRARFGDTVKVLHDEARTLLIEAIELLRGLQARGEMSPRISTALAGLSRDEGSLAGP